jgi:hypothetical protein
VFYLWRSAYNIHDSDANDYSVTDIFNSGVDKYYMAKKMYGIPGFDANK